MRRVFQTIFGSTKNKDALFFAELIFFDSGGVLRSDEPFLWSYEEIQRKANGIGIWARLCLGPSEIGIAWIGSMGARRAVVGTDARRRPRKRGGERQGWASHQPSNNWHTEVKWILFAPLTIGSNQDMAFFRFP
eukprot:3841176-Prymnesium_polylepis.1